MIRRQLLAQERCRKRLGHLHSCHQPMGDKPWFQKISNPSPSSRPTFSVSMKILNARSKGPKTGQATKKHPVYEIIMMYRWKFEFPRWPQIPNHAPPFGISLKKFRNKLQESESVSVFGPRSNPDKSLKGKLCDASIIKHVKCWKLVWGLMIAMVSDPMVRRSDDPMVRRSDDPMVHWSADPMVRWSDGPLIRRSNGPMVRWSDDPMVRRSDDPLVRWSAGPLIRRSDDPMVRWSADPTIRWSAGPLIRWSADPTIRWSDGRWSADPTIRWSDDPMVRWSADPTIRWSDGPLVRWSDDPLIRWSAGPLIDPMVRWSEIQRSKFEPQWRYHFGCDCLPTYPLQVKAQQVLKYWFRICFELK